MKPTEQSAKTPSPRTGIFATLRGLRYARGSGAPARGLIVTALCALLACALQGALSAGVARAEVPKLVANGQFASEGGGLGVAVDQSSGDVFVTGFVYFPENGNLPTGRIEKFDASDKLLSPPSPFGEILNYGAAVNPTNGDLYVARFSGEIDTYDPNTGALLSSFPVSPFWAGGLEPFENVAQIAADSAGNVYVPNVPGNEVLKYSPTGTLLETFTGSGAHALSRPNGVAIDSSGNLWVADAGNNRIEELDPTGAFLAEIKSEGVRTIALDGHGDVLAIVDNGADSCGELKPPCDHLVEYSSSGARLADLGAGELGSAALPPVLSSMSFSMVAVSDASGRVYVTDAQKDRVLVFQPPVAPVLGQESAVEVGTVEAKLGALVSPGGAKTAYRFEYDTREYTEGEGPHGVSVPFPEGSAGQGFSARAVWESAKGLAPGTTYHYRAVATNGVGDPVVGRDQTFTTETVAQTACPNEQLRGGFSGALPDCRAYEVVVPPNKASAQPDTNLIRLGAINQTGTDGNRIAWPSTEVLSGSPSAGFEYVSTRGASGWSSEDVIPLQSYTGDRCPWHVQSDVVQYSPDLSKAVLFVNGNGGWNTILGRQPCRGNVVEVVPGEPSGAQNLLLRDNTDGTYRLIDLTPPGVTPADANLVAASADLSLVIFNDGAKLTPDAPSTGGTYEWNNGVVRLLKFTLPDGAPVEGSRVSISHDGAEVFFTAGGNLYVRLNDERTVQLDEARGGAGPGGGGAFAGLTADGSQVFFTDDASAGLTKDTVPGSGPNLYRYDIDTGSLSDLTPVAHAEAALQGISEDGAYVYFTAGAVLSGPQANQFGETAESGQPNLYLSHGGTIVFVRHRGGVGMSPNGAYLVFESYIYSAASNRSQCWSCNPFGAPGAVEARSGVSNNGQIFFQTGEALLPGDTNGQSDIYEYSYTGGLHLITTGTSRAGVRLLGAGDSGNDVFFLGRQALLPGESNEESLTIYDARVDGGFPATAVPVCTTADACRAAPAPQPSIFGEPASQTFSGAGNLASPEAKPKAKPKAKPVKCRKGSVKKRGKCVKKPKKKARKSAHANRTGK